MGTRDRILEAARRLFNDAGEANISASDIAASVDLSPGNLHYHFPGKDRIHQALFDTFQRDMIMLMAPAVQTPGLFQEQDQDQEGAIETSWLFFTVVMEKIFSHRYLYDTTVQLIHQDPGVARGMRRLLGLKQKACLVIAQELLSDQGSPRPPNLDRLAEAMCFSLTGWPAYSRLQYPGENDTVLLHRGVLQVLAQCAPHLDGDRREFYLECDNMYTQMVQGPESTLD